MRKFLSRNDHVRNKDCQEKAAVTRLADEKLIKYLQEPDFVSHTIIPEMDHFNEHNRVGMYPHPINIAVGPYSSLLFLKLNQERYGSKSYMAQLHNPQVEVLEESVAAKEVHFTNNIIFLTGKDGPFKFHEVFKVSVLVDVRERRNRGEVLVKANELGFALGGTVVEVKLKCDYGARGFHSDQINFWNAENQSTFQFEAINVVSSMEPARKVILLFPSI